MSTTQPIQLFEHIQQIAKPITEEVLEGTASGGLSTTQKNERWIMRMESANGILYAVAMQWRDLKHGKVHRTLFIKGNLDFSQGDEFKLSFPDLNGNNVIDPDEQKNPQCQVFGKKCASVSLQQVNDRFETFKKALKEKGKPITMAELKKYWTSDFEKETAQWKKEMQGAVEEWKDEVDLMEATGKMTNKTIAGIGEAKITTMPVAKVDINNDGIADRVILSTTTYDVDCSKIDLFQNPFEVTIENAFTTSSNLILETQYEDAQELCKGAGGKVVKANEERYSVVYGGSSEVKNKAGTVFQKGDLVQFTHKGKKEAGVITDFIVLPKGTGYQLAAEINVVRMIKQEGTDKLFPWETGKITLQPIDEIQK